MPITPHIEMVSYSIVALHEPDHSGWRMLVLDCDPEEVSTRLTEQGIGALPYRLVSHGNAPYGSGGNLGATRGWRAGWDEIKDTALWLPVDEPLPPLPGTPVPVSVKLTLGHILNGFINLTLSLGARRAELAFDDIEDSLILFTRFVQLLVRGGEPHAWLANSACAHFNATDAGAGVCQLQIRLIDDSQQEMIDVITDRDSLTEEFRGLARAIADHPYFAHMWLCHCVLPDDDYERVCDTAEVDWQRGVTAGHFPDVWDAEQRFTAERIVAEVPLSEELSQLAKNYHQMLHTLEIPPEWQGRAG